MDRHTALEQLGGAYFTKTGPMTRDGEEVVVDYLNDEPIAPELLAGSTDSFPQTLTRRVGRCAGRGGFCYDPTRDGKTNRSWLQDIARIAAGILRRPADRE